MEKIRISLEKAKLFGILSPGSGVKKDNIEVSIKSIKQKKDNVVIRTEISNLTKNPKAKTLTYDQEKLTPYEATFVGWAFLLLADYKNNYKERAKKFLEYAVRIGTDSCFPFYLLFYYDLEAPDDYRRAWVYDPAGKKDVFPEFFHLLWRKEKNKIKALGFVKKGLQKFPHDIRLATIWASYLVKEGRFEETLIFLRQLEPINFEKTHFTDSERYQFLVFESLVKLKKFEQAEEFLSRAKLLPDALCFLKGLLCFEKKDYKKAIEFFNMAIEEDVGYEVTQASLYYLLECYLLEHDVAKVKDIIELLPNEEIHGITEFAFFYRNTAKDILEKILKIDIDEIAKAKAKGNIAYIILLDELPIFEKQDRKLTSEELRSLNYGLCLIRESLEYYPYSKTFNGVCSDLLYLTKDYDNAVKYKLRILSDNKGEEYYAEADLKKCSDVILNTYHAVLKDEIGANEEAINEYIKYSFDGDIKTLYDRKKYQIIVNLFNWLKKKLDLSKVGEWGGDEGGLFEIAFSLKEVGDIEQAGYIYEKEKEIHGEGCSILNNLAIIYEEKGNLPKARTYIKKARQLTKGEDEIINRNFARLFAKSKKRAGRISAAKTEGRRAPKHLPGARLPEFDKNTGDITFGKRKCHIANPGNYQYHICEMLISITKPGKLVTEQEIQDKYTSVGTFRSPRWVKDAVYKINDKVEKSLGIKRLISYKNSNLRLRKEIFE